MRFFILLHLLLIWCFYSPFLYSEPWNLSKKNTSPKSKYDELYGIQVIDGLPQTRPYKRLELLQVQAENLKMAMRKIKHQAKSLKADAIIELEVSEAKHSLTLGAYSENDLKIESSSHVVVKGWAIVWIEN